MQGGAFLILAVMCGVEGWVGVGVDWVGVDWVVGLD